MEPTTASVAQRLRRVRQARGWSLAQVENESGGRIKVAALGSYERCDRALSLERTIMLADIYGVPLNYLTGAPDTAISIETGEPVMINLRRARSFAENSSAETAEEFHILYTFLMWLAGRRNDWNGEVMSLRQSDFETLALMTFRAKNELLEWLLANKILITGIGHP